MRTNEEFNHFYAQELHAQTQRLERQRDDNKPALTKHRNQSIIASVIYLIIVFILFKSSIFSVFPLVIVGLVAVVFVFYFRHVNKFQKKMNDQIKSSLIPDLLHFVEPNLTYRPSEFIPKQDFLASNLFAEHQVDIYNGDDLIGGYVGDTNIKFSELNVKQRYKDSEGETKEKTTFKGLFFVMDFNKSFEGSLYALPKMVKNNFFSKFMGQRSTSSGERLEQVDLENGVFNDTFLVRTTDQLLARYVLTPAFMEALMRYKTKSDYIPMFSFSEGVMYLALRTNREHLEFNLRKGIDQEMVRTYFEDINLSLQIVEELQLNTRLWG